jgi:DNA-binding winged helix-turn-helix (wHTH) protein
MKVVDIAQEIYFDLNSPSDLSIAAIAFWVRANVGALNSYLFSNFVVDETTYEIVDADNTTVQIDINAVAILKKMYVIHRYAVIIRSKLTSTDSDDVVEVTHNDTKVRKLDKNQLIKTVSAEKKQEEESLKLLISAYRGKKFVPGQVVGDDIVAGSYPDNYPYIRSGRTYGYTAY